jgi:NADH dehydrogenase FAD-containing subunit
VVLRLIDVYVFPRFSILPDHAPKAFIPYTKMLDPADLPVESNEASSSKFPTPPLSPASSTSSFSSHEEEMPLRQFIQGTVTHLTSHSVSFIRPASRRTGLLLSMGSSTTVGTYDFEGPEETLVFDYCIYALGSGMPDPCNVWSEHPNLPPGIDNDEHLTGKGSKKCGVTWMAQKAKDRKEAKRILIVGGGALGIRESIFPFEDTAEE